MQNKRWGVPLLQLLCKDFTLSFNTSVLVNNLLALKAFRTFLNNYKQHEMPKKAIRERLRLWLERKLVAFIGESLRKTSRQRFLVELAKNLVETHAQKVMSELMSDNDAKTAFATLKDAPVGVFALLYIVQHPHLLSEVRSAKELFDLISQTELTVALLKNPREEQSYK